MSSFWLALLALLFSATIGSSYVVTPSTAGSTQGGSSITITGSWQPAVWTPIITLQGMSSFTASDWFMSSTTLLIKVPAGPGCGDASSSLVVYTDCSPAACNNQTDPIERVNVRFSYDPPEIVSVEPDPADFGNGAMSMTITGINFGKNTCQSGTPQLPSIKVNAFFVVICLNVTHLF
jgi:hypothetical protein